MDGFHLDNRLLIARGLLARKGAPETFAASAFVHLVRRLKEEQEVVYPVFDRALDIAIAGAGVSTLNVMW
jgi:fructokinase